MAVMILPDDDIFLDPEVLNALALAEAGACKRPRLLPHGRPEVRGSDEGHSTSRGDRLPELMWRPDVMGASSTSHHPPPSSLQVRDGGVNAGRGGAPESGKAPASALIPPSPSSSTAEIQHGAGTGSGETKRHRDSDALALVITELPPSPLAPPAWQRHSADHQHPPPQQQQQQQQQQKPKTSVSPPQRPNQVMRNESREWGRGATAYNQTSTAQQQKIDLNRLGGPNQQQGQCGGPVYRLQPSHRDQQVSVPSSNDAQNAGKSDSSRYPHLSRPGPSHQRPNVGGLSHDNGMGQANGASMEANHRRSLSSSSPVRCNGYAGRDKPANGRGQQMAGSGGGSMGNGRWQHDVTDGGGADRALALVRGVTAEGNGYGGDGGDGAGAIVVHERRREREEVVPMWVSSKPAVSEFVRYQEAAFKILSKGDVAMVQGKQFIKKSGWRKLAFFFGISLEIKDKQIVRDATGNVLRSEFTARAVMQSGRFAEGYGSCDRAEKRFCKPNHDVPTTAETRAKNRAVQDLLGIGDCKSG